MHSISAISAAAALAAAALLTAAEAPASPPPNEATVDLSNGSSVRIAIDRVERHPSGEQSWIGRAVDGPGTVVLGVSGDFVSGSMTADGESWRIRGPASGPFRAEPVSGDLYVCSGGPSFEPDGASPLALDGAQGHGRAIDVLVVYTQGAENAAGSEASIRGIIAERISRGNLIYENSGAALRLRLVHVAKVAEAESGNSSTDLSRLTNPSDGFFDAAHTLRNTHGADLVHLIVSTFASEPNVGGRANTMTTISPGFASQAFAVTALDAADDFNYTVTHEMGHNMGLHHGSGDPAAKPYGVGFWDNGMNPTPPMQSVRTVMNNSGSCCVPRIAHHSSDTVLFDGRPTGSASVDAARALGDAMSTVAGFRASVVGGHHAGLHDPTSGAWFLRHRHASGPANDTFFFGAAGAGHVGTPGNWDGDPLHTETAGLYDPATSTFFLRNENSNGPAAVAFQFGGPSASILPVAGDWNGDGVDGIGLYDSATGVFFLRNGLSPGPADLTFQFGGGGATTRPIIGDWNGNGTDTIGLHDSSTGTFFLRNSNSSGPAATAFQFGAGGATVRPLAGDWNADGFDSIGFHDLSTGVFFLNDSNAPGPANHTYPFGSGGRPPLAGAWVGN